MTFRAVIEPSKTKQFVASVAIYNEKNEYECGYYITEIEDKRLEADKNKPSFTMEDLLNFVNIEDQRLQDKFNYKDITKRILTRMIKVSEEVGELSDEVLSSLNLQRKEKNDRYRRENLEDEFADVIFVTLLLAKTMDVDIVKASKRKAKKVHKYYEQNKE